jgi:tRNA (guanine-N7-)-methyltransferase
LRRPRRTPVEDLAPYLLPIPEELGFLNWPKIFGNERPVEVEIGFGKGLFLLTEATSRPAVNFVGVEIARKYQLFAATRMAKRGLTNVRLAKADARLFLRDGVPSESCQAVHVYFPDPWWKKRHLRRRVFTLEFAAQCERVLRPAGCLHLATDVAEYFSVMVAAISSATRLKQLPTPGGKAPAHDMDYLTNFERKSAKAGRPISRAVFEKTVQ